MAHFEFVVSAENHHYLVWQAMLFHYSCLRFNGQAPLVMVHTDPDVPLLAGFRRIVETGGRIQIAPNLRRWNGVNHPPRNTPASLQHARTDADYIVLCDCDMVFLRRFPVERLELGPCQVGFDAVPYLDPEGPNFQPRLDDACRRADVRPERLREVPMSGGVPHVIPRGLQTRLADDWLHCTDLFPTIGPWDKSVSIVESTECHMGSQRDWLASMWGLVFAMHRLKLQPAMTNLCWLNLDGGQPLPTDSAEGPDMIHYCYGDERFNKRLYDSAEAAEERVWNVAADDGTLNGAIRRQLREACDFYGLGAD